MVEKQSALESKARSWLIERGVEIDDIAELVLFLQQKYHPGLELDICRQNVEHVLRKREVQNAVLTGIQLDVMAEKGELVPNHYKISLALMRGCTASTRYLRSPSSMCTDLLDLPITVISIK